MDFRMREPVGLVDHVDAVDEMDEMDEMGKTDAAGVMEGPPYDCHSYVFTRPLLISRYPCSTSSIGLDVSIRR